MFSIFPINGGVCATDGFTADGIHCGLKQEEKLDLAFIKSDTPCVCTAVFTTNRFQAAPIIDAKKKIENEVDAVLINAKNANAMTGEQGLENIQTILKEFPATNSIMSSTGVIGVQLPVEKIVSGIKKFDYSQKNGNRASKAIMTTDAFEKEIALKVKVNNKEFTIGAMAKGAGMIAPALATMLCFVTTDIDLSKQEIQEILENVLDDSFNAISVDGDMSTNDTVLVLSNRKSSVNDKEAFQEALKMVLHKLALDIARDGEGAKKLAAFQVVGAKTKEEAKKVAKDLSNSLLVKTALFGEDPNWGRIASTVGASGIECCEKNLKIAIGEVVIYDKEGLMTPELEEKAYRVLQNKEFAITVDIGLGEENFTAYGCDLGYDYVKINAEYRT